MSGECGGLRARKVRVRRKGRMAGDQQTRGTERAGAIRGQRPSVHSDCVKETERKGRRRRRRRTVRRTRRGRRTGRGRRGRRRRVPEEADGKESVYREGETEEKG